MSYKQPNASSTPPVVLGIAGRIGSGKTTLSNALSHYLGWKSVNLGDYLRTLAGHDFKGSRGELQEIGARVLNQPLPLVCQNILDYAGWHHGDGLILDGLRKADVIREFKRVVAPTRFLLTYVEVQGGIREARYHQRVASQGSDLSEVETHHMEQEAVTILRDIADIIIEGNIPIDDEVEFVIKRVHESIRQHELG